MPHINSFNIVILLGRLGKDPEFKEVRVKVCNFSVATTEIYGRGTDRKEKTEWTQVVAFGRLAEFCRDNLTKGMTVFIEGRLSTSFYKEKRYVSVQADTVVPVKSKTPREEEEPKIDDTEKAPF